MKRFIVHAYFDAGDKTTEYLRDLVKAKLFFYDAFDDAKLTNHNTGFSTEFVDMGGDFETYTMHEKLNQIVEEFPVSFSMKVYTLYSDPVFCSYGVLAEMLHIDHMMRTCEKDLRFVISAFSDGDMNKDMQRLLKSIEMYQAKNASLFKRKIGLE